MNKTNRAEKQRYGVPWFEGASRSGGQRFTWPLAINANRCIFRSVLNPILRIRRTNDKLLVLVFGLFLFS
jgi:hypothetical protein